MKRLISLFLVVLLGFAFVIPISSSWSAGTLKVTSPNGGQSWRTGKSYRIRWNKGNGGKYVKILLFKSGRAYKLLSKKTRNDGKHVWKVPNSVATSGQYKIRIRSVTKKRIFDDSNDYFTIANRTPAIAQGNNNGTLFGRSIGRGTDKSLYKAVPVIYEGERAATAYIGRSNSSTQTIYWSIPATNTLVQTYYCFIKLENIAFYDKYNRLLTVDGTSYIDGSVGDVGYDIYTDTCLASGESGIWKGIELANGTALYSRVSKIVVGNVDGDDDDMNYGEVLVLPKRYKTYGSYNDAFVTVKNEGDIETTIGSFSVVYLLNANGHPIFWDYPSGGDKDVRPGGTYNMNVSPWYKGSVSSIRVFMDLEPSWLASTASKQSVCSGSRDKIQKCRSDVRNERLEFIRKSTIERR